MSDRDTARTRRSRQQALESKRFAAACYETDTAPAEVARTLGCAASKMTRWSDPESREVPSAADIACMPSAVRRWYLDDDARRMGLRIVQVSTSLEISDQLRHLTDVSRESGEATSTHAAALADAHMTDDELREVAREYGEAAQVAASAQHSLLAELERRIGRPA